MVFRFLLTWLLIDVCWTLVEWRHYGELVSSSSKPTMFVCLCGPTIVFYGFFLHFLVFPLMYIFQQPLYPKLIPKSESNLCNVFNRSLSCQFNTWSALIWTTHIFFFQGTSRLEASLPMTGFLEQLPADKSLKFLDLSAAWREAQMEKLIQDGAPQL